ncbi:MAG: cofactor assembly of complex C subunit B [Cyanobacteria bacterium J06649_5]
MFFTDPARASTLLLTSLMVIGLVFFIRASTKDRIEAMQFGSIQEADALQKAVIKYFYTRAYKPATEAESSSLKSDQGPTVVNGMTLVGMVSPSVFMAVFLSTLAAVGFACLGLIMSTLFPSWGRAVLALIFASPLAGVFYWQKSSRPETIVLKVEPETAQAARSKLTVKGHRDELAELQNAFSQPELKEWAALKQWEREA